MSADELVRTVREALLVLRDGSLTASMASNAPPALAALDSLAAEIARLEAENRDMALHRPTERDLHIARAAIAFELTQVRDSLRAEIEAKG